MSHRRQIARPTPLTVAQPTEQSLCASDFQSKRFAIGPACRSRCRDAGRTLEVQHITQSTNKVLGTPQAGHHAGRVAPQEAASIVNTSIGVRAPKRTLCLCHRCTWPSARGCTAVGSIQACVLPACEPARKRKKAWPASSACPPRRPRDRPGGARAPASSVTTSRGEAVCVGPGDAVLVACGVHKVDGLKFAARGQVEAPLLPLAAGR